MNLNHERKSGDKSNSHEETRRQTERGGGGGLDQSNEPWCDNLAKIHGLRRQTNMILLLASFEEQESLNLCNKLTNMRPDWPQVAMGDREEGGESGMGFAQDWRFSVLAI